MLPTRLMGWTAPNLPSGVLRRLLCSAVLGPYVLHSLLSMEVNFALHTNSIIYPLVRCVWKSYCFFTSHSIFCIILLRDSYQSDEAVLYFLLWFAFVGSLMWLNICLCSCSFVLSNSLSRYSIFMVTFPSFSFSFVGIPYVFFFITYLLFISYSSIGSSISLPPLQILTPHLIFPISL